MDSDLNYTVTKIEFATALRHEFERLDVNGDKVLTRAELLMAAPMRMQGGGGDGGEEEERGDRSAHGEWSDGPSSPLPVTCGDGSDRITDRPFGRSILYDGSELPTTPSVPSSSASGPSTARY